MIGRLVVMFALAATPAVASSLDRNVIRRPIRGAMPRITRCYDKQLLANPKLGDGKVTVAFTIAATGKVTEATATAIGIDDAVASCVAGVIRTLQFPRSPSGPIRVNYPFVFRR